VQPGLGRPHPERPAAEALRRRDNRLEALAIHEAHTGLVVVEVSRTEPWALARLVEACEALQPALVAQGHRILGHFVAELTPNDYPRLPVVQDPAILVVLSAYRDLEHYAALHPDPGASGPDGRRAMQTLLTGEVATMALRPTARSVIRYQP